MIRSIEIKGLRAIRYAKVDLSNFQVLVGPNASGKSTFFDSIHLIRDVLNFGLHRAIHGDIRFGIPQRAVDPRDVTWLRQGAPVEIALTIDLPDEVRRKLNSRYRTARYEIGISCDDTIAFAAESLFLCRTENGRDREGPSRQTLLFPQEIDPPKSILRPPGSQAPKGWRKILNKTVKSGNDYFRAERVSGTPEDS